MGGCHGCPSLWARRVGSGTQSMRMMLGCILDGAPSETLAVWSIVHTNDGSTLCAAMRALIRLYPSGAASASASTLPLTPGSPRPWACWLIDEYRIARKSGLCIGGIVFSRGGHASLCGRPARARTSSRAPSERANAQTSSSYTIAIGGRSTLPAVLH